MDTTANVQINIEGNVFVDVQNLFAQFTQIVDVVAEVNESVVDSTNQITEHVDKTSDSFGELNKKIDRISFASAVGQVKQLAEGVAGLSGPGIGFEQSMADLSAATGIVGRDLQTLAQAARQTGAESGIGAAAAAQAFQALAAQTDVGKTGIEGLKTLQQQTLTLSGAAGISMSEAAEALTGTIGRFGLQAEESGRVVNVLAAGAKNGSAGITELAAALRTAGEAAAGSGVSLEEAAGAAEVLAKADIRGAEAGEALRGIMKAMQTTLGMDVGKTGFAAALDALKPKLTDAAYLSKVFGTENLDAAQFLIGNAEAVAGMTVQLTGTCTAQEQAAVRTQTTQQMMARLRARIDDLKISFTEATGPVGGYAVIIAEQAESVGKLVPVYQMVKKGLAEAGPLFGELRGRISELGPLFGKLRSWISELGPWFGKLGSRIMGLGPRFVSLFSWVSGFGSVFRKCVSGVGPLIGKLGTWITSLSMAQKLSAFWTGVVGTASAVWTGIQWALNASLWACPLTWIVAAVLALAGVVVLCATKVQGWGRQWDSIVKFMKLTGKLFVETIKYEFNTLVDGIMIGLDLIKLGWYKFKRACGLGDSSENEAMIGQIEGDIEKRQTAIAKGAENLRKLAAEASGSLTYELGIDRGESARGRDTTTSEEPRESASAETWGSASAEPRGSVSERAMPRMPDGTTVPAADAADQAAEPGLTAAVDKLSAVLSGFAEAVKSLTPDVPELTAAASGTASAVQDLSTAVPGLTSAVQEQTAAAKTPQGGTGAPAAQGAPYAPPDLTFSGMLGLTPKTTPAPKQSEAVQKPAARPVRTSVPPGPQAAAAAGGMSGLDRIVPESRKGSTTYAAVASRLPRSKVPALAAAAAALPLTVAATTLPQEAVPAARTQTEYYAGGTPHGITAAKFCDTVEIHIASADGKGYNQIEQEVADVLKKVLDNYEA